MLTRHPIWPLVLEGMKGPRPRALREDAAPGLRNLTYRSSASRQSTLVRSATPASRSSRTRVISTTRALSLDSCGIGEAGVKALASSPIFANLEALNLRRTAFGDAALEMLRTSSHLSKLRQIVISDRIADEAGAGAVDALRKRYEVGSEK